MMWHWYIIRTWQYVPYNRRGNGFKTIFDIFQEKNVGAITVTYSLFIQILNKLCYFLKMNLVDIVLSFIYFVDLKIYVCFSMYNTNYSQIKRVCLTMMSQKFTHVSKLMTINQISRHY